MTVKFTGGPEIYKIAFAFGVVTVLFWAITYILIILAGYQSHTERRLAIPYLATVLNLGCELCAIYYWRYDGLWAFVLWSLLDLFIVYYGLIFLDSRIKRITYLCSIVISIIGFYFIFPLNDGFIYSVYIINLVMAVCFLVERKKISAKYKISIAIMKLIGNVCAIFVFGYDFISIVVIELIVLVCDSLYLYLCIKERHMF